MCERVYTSFHAHSLVHNVFKLCYTLRHQLPDIPTTKHLPHISTPIPNHTNHIPPLIYLLPHPLRPRVPPHRPICMLAVQKLSRREYRYTPRVLNDLPIVLFHIEEYDEPIALEFVEVLAADRDGDVLNVCIHNLPRPTGMWPNGANKITGVEQIPQCLAICDGDLLRDGCGGLFDADPRRSRACISRYPPVIAARVQLVRSSNDINDVIGCGADEVPRLATARPKPCASVRVAVQRGMWTSADKARRRR